MLGLSVHRRIRLGLALVLVTLATIRAGSQDSQRPSALTTTWRVGHPVPILVAGGRARFRVPMAETSGDTLVVVSSLARGAGAFPIRLKARRVSTYVPPALADDGATRPVRLDVPPLPP